MSDQNEHEDGPPRITRVIDFHVTLPWVLSCIAAFAFVLVTMYFNLNQLIRDVGELQIVVKTGNTQSVTLAGDQALLRFRIENIEGTLRDMRKEGGKQ